MATWNETKRKRALLWLHLSLQGESTRSIAVKCSKKGAPLRTILRREEQIKKEIAWMKEAIKGVDPKLISLVRAGSNIAGVVTVITLVEKGYKLSILVSARERLEEVVSFSSGARLILAKRVLRELVEDRSSS